MEQEYLIIVETGKIYYSYMEMSDLVKKQQWLENCGLISLLEYYIDKLINNVYNWAR